MRKALLASAVTLSLAACAAPPPQGANGIQVQDLSLAREQSTNGTYTVEPGDTLYGIAWRYEMDFRDLAQLNGITPPYRIQPGQQLSLAGGQAGARQGTAIAQAETSSRSGDQTQASGGGESPDWLEPDTSAIERNRRLTSAALPAASAGAGETDDAQASRQGTEQGATAGGKSEQAPGPVYNYESPGADGTLSAADRAERDALEQAQASEQAPQGQTPQDQAAEQAPQTQAKTATASSSASEQDAADRQPDAGAAVAGEVETTERRTYQPVDEVAWQWPAEGEVVNGFGEGSSITAGIDIGGQKGQSVKAAGPGIVVYAGDGVRGYGNLILLKHNNQFLSAYAHNDSLQVKENDVVEAGEVIATMGDTDADAVKLHFEVRKDGQPQDPLTFLPKR